MGALPLQCSVWVWGVLEYDFDRIKGSLDIEPNPFGCWGQCFVMSIIYTWHFNKWCPSVQSSSTQLMYFTAFALSHRNIHSCSGCPMGSAPPQSQDGEGKSSAPGAHPCLPRDWISQAENPKEATFIISAFENHLQSVCSILLQPNTSQCNSVLWEVGQSWEKGGIWELVPWEIHLGSPRKHQIGNLTRGFLQSLAFSLMSSHYVLHTLQQGDSPMPPDTYKVLSINWHLP